MKKLKGIKREKEFDTMTLITDIDTDLADGEPTQVYEPRPLTPDDDIYEAMQLFFISSIFFLGYSIQFRYLMGNARFNKIVSAISETLEKFLKTYKEDKK